MRRIDGPTPNGGAYSEVYYYDDVGNEVDVSQATRAYGCEFDKSGKMIQETHFVLKDEQSYIKNQDKQQEISHKSK